MITPDQQKKIDELLSSSTSTPISTGGSSNDWYTGIKNGAYRPNGISAPVRPDEGPLGGVADFIGGSKIAAGLGQTIANSQGAQDKSIQAQNEGSDIETNLIKRIHADRALGKDTSRLESALTTLGGNLQKEGEATTDLGTGGLSNKEVVGSAIQLGANLIPGAGKGAGLLEKSAMGAATGYAYDVGNQLQDKNKSVGRAFVPGLGTAIGGTLPLAAHLVGSLAKHIAGFNAGTGSEVIQRAVDNPDTIGEAVNKYATTPEAKQTLVDKARAAISNFVQEKQDEYGASINKLGDNNVGASIDRHLASANQVLQEMPESNIPSVIERLKTNIVDGLKAEGKDVADISKLNPSDFKTAQEFATAAKDAVGGVGVQSVTDSFVENAKKFGGSLNKNGDLVFKNSTLTKSDQTAIKAAFDTVQNWTDESPKGLDSLRQAIGNHMEEFSLAHNDRANVVLGAVKSDLTDSLSDKLPGYSDMLTTYGKKSQLTKDIVKELQLGGTAKVSTQLNNVMRIFKKDPALRENLIKIMGEDGANKFLNELSGAILSDWVPQGQLMPILKGVLEAGAATTALATGAGAITTAPIAAAGVASMSPRIVGAAARGIGKAANAGVGKAAERLATMGASEIGQGNN